MTDKRDRLRAVVLGRLESLERAGVLQLPKPSQVTASASRQVAAAADTVAATPPPGEDQPVTKTRSWRSAGGDTLFDAAEGDRAAATVSQAPSLSVLAEEVTGCTCCGELASARTQTVFGVGNPRARLCFMGEAPGADEDRQGEPFVGRAGQLLNKILEACRLKREEVYILNMLKCRPPGNRNPLPGELANCRRYLDRQLELIEPEFICCLGAVAAQNLLATTIGIGKLRGKLHTYRGAQVVCTFHPAYLLRNPAAKKDAWEDMKFLMRAMGVEL